MPKHSDPHDDWDARKASIIGLGEHSLHKSYYPQLRQNMERLEHFRLLLDQTPDCVILVERPHNRIADANAALGRLLNKPVESLIGQPYAVLGLGDIAPVYEEMCGSSGDHSACGTQFAQAQIVELHAAQADSIWLELSYSCALVGESCYGVIVGRDISERKRNHEMLANLLAEKEALLENSIVGIAMIRQRQIVSCNRRFEEMLGYAPGSLIGASTRQTYSSEDAFNSLGEEGYYALSQGRNFTGSVLLTRADGSDFWAEITRRAFDPQHPHAGSIWIFTDITERRQAEERARFLAYHDALTGLPNLQLMQDRLERAIQQAGHSEGKMALMVVDLDRFKAVNDSLGHGLGDQLLIAVGQRLRQSVADTDTVCRQGGDEFLILLPTQTDMETCIGLLGQLMLGLSAPFRIDGIELTLTASIGIALCPDDGMDLESLLKKAEMAMHQAKEAGRNTYRFFDEAMNSEASDQLSLHFGLRQALEQKQFFLCFQPQIEIASGELIGAEALLRWQHPQMGLISPARFIPVAEESGLIVPIGEWVLQQACIEAARWQAAGHTLAVAVNLSALQFKRGDIEQSVIRALADSGLEPGLLELEITESLLLQDTEKVLATVIRLKHLGVKLSIDDFGTGYSSLAYLKRFKVDKLKIDQSFIRDLANDPDDAAIVRAVIQMARSLGLRTIAEGVEDQQTLDHLRLYHCDEAQGYHYARPMPASDFLDYLRPEKSRCPK